MQNQDEASLVHAMDLASGKRVRRIMVKTLAESFTWESLDYIGAIGGDEDAEDIRGFHSSLLLAHLGYLNEVHQYHISFPWKIILATQPCYREDLMTEMQSLWSFITENIDTLSPKSTLHKACSWTRAQCFREVFVVAEFLALHVPVILSLDPFHTYVPYLDPYVVIYIYICIICMQTDIYIYIYMNMCSRSHVYSHA